MEQEMLRAAQEAAWAAQSAGEAAWWSLGANVLLACLTLATLLSTIRIANRSLREAREKDAAYLIGLQTILLKINAAVEGVTAEPARAPKFYRTILSVLEDSELLVLYGSMDIRHIATTAGLKSFLDGKVAAHQMRFHLQMLAQNPAMADQRASLREASDNVRICADRLGEEAAKLNQSSRFERLLSH